MFVAKNGSSLSDIEANLVRLVPALAPPPLAEAMQLLVILLSSHHETSTTPPAAAPAFLRARR